MKNRAPFSILVIAVTAGFHFSACGGRTSSDGYLDDADGGRTIATGTSGTTGASTGAGGRRATGSGATTGGVTTGTGGSAGSAGRAGGGGASSCPNVACDAVACGPGFRSVLEPGACCPVCKPVCNQACPIPLCPTGQHLEIPPGACCAVCVPDKSTACEQGQRAYVEFRAMLANKYASLGCMTNGDCTTVYETNRCTASCGVAIPVSGAGFFDQNLRSFADSNCATCAPQAPPPCVPSSVSCVGNRCALFPGGLGGP